MLTIKELREKKKISQNVLAQKLGVSLRTVQNYEANQDKIPLDKLSKIYRELELDLPGNLSLEDMFDHNGKTTKGFIYPDGLEENNITGFYYPNVSAAAGMDKEMVNDELKRIPINLPNWEKGIDFINVYGDSMYPKFCSGEIIGIKEVELQYINYGYAYVVIFNDGQVFLKYINPGSDKDHWLLSSENPKHPPKEYHLSLIKKIFIIKGVITKTTM